MKYKTIGKYPNRLSSEGREEVRKLYTKENKSIKEIAIFLGRSYDQIWRIIKYVPSHRDRTTRVGHKKYIQEIRESNICKTCGESHPACLEFHHRNPKEKKFTLGRAVLGNYTKDQIIEEIQKCDIFMHKLSSQRTL